jgi:hypothetical protein
MLNNESQALLAICRTLLQPTLQIALQKQSDSFLDALRKQLRVSPMPQALKMLLNVG